MVRPYALSVISSIYFLLFLRLHFVIWLDQPYQNNIYLAQQKKKLSKSISYKVFWYCDNQKKSWEISQKASMLKSHFNKITRHAHSTLLKWDSDINVLHEILQFFQISHFLEQVQKCAYDFQILPSSLLVKFCSQPANEE